MAVAPSCSLAGVHVATAAGEGGGKGDAASVRGSAATAVLGGEAAHSGTNSPRRLGEQPAVLHAIAQTSYVPPQLSSPTKEATGKPSASGAIGTIAEERLPVGRSETDAAM